MPKAFTISLFALLATPSCVGSNLASETTDTQLSPQATSSAALADVLQVSVTGVEGAYTFAVTLQSPDTGCTQYADWWEVLSPDGVLKYRRVLAHSHVDEQPFTRSGGPVIISETDTVIIRGHMNTVGYGGGALRGSVSGGFSVDSSVDASFAGGLAVEAPLPSSCAF